MMGLRVAVAWNGPIDAVLRYIRMCLLKLGLPLVYCVLSFYQHLGGNMDLMIVIAQKAFALEESVCVSAESLLNRLGAFTGADKEHSG